MVASLSSLQGLLKERHKVPYKSDAQRRFMHVKHPDIAKKWDKEYPNQKGLPEKKSKFQEAAKRKLKKHG